MAINHPGCSSKSEPASKFEDLFLELWEVFDQHYAFFELREVDWQQEKPNFLKSIPKIESDSVFFDQLCSLLKKFDDTHINLESEGLNRYCNAGKLPNFLKEFPSNEAFSTFLSARDQSLNQIGIDTLKDSPSGVFQYGWSADMQWAYLRIKRFYGAGLDVLEQELLEINQSIGKAKRLLLDIRTNPGGNDETALLCASPYFQQSDIAFIKQRRNGPDYEDFSPLDTTYINPNSRIKADHQDIFLLSNGAAGSSADVFALIMANLPQVTLVGTNTEGIFSDMYRATLSNGWTLTLSNERYYSKDMICYEKVGVPVDLEVKNNFEDAKKGVDLLIQKVLGLLP